MAKKLKLKNNNVDLLPIYYNFIYYIKWRKKKERINAQHYFEKAGVLIIDYCGTNESRIFYVE